MSVVMAMLGFGALTKVSFDPAPGLVGPRGPLVIYLSYSLQLEISVSDFILV
jgi:hypothetical protein